MSQLPRKQRLELLRADWVDMTRNRVSRELDLEPESLFWMEERCAACGNDLEPCVPWDDYLCPPCTALELPELEALVRAAVMARKAVRA